MALNFSQDKIDSLASGGKLVAENGGRIHQLSSMNRAAKELPKIDAPETKTEIADVLDAITKSMAEAQASSAETNQAYAAAFILVLEQNKDLLTAVKAALADKPKQKEQWSFSFQRDRNDRIISSIAKQL